MLGQFLARLLKIDLFAASLCLTLCICSLPGCFRAPQVTADAGVFSELDALYTAVTAKRSDLLEETYSRISQLHADQRLSDAGLRKITAIVELARQENWQKASEQLYQFMRAQRKRPGSQVSVRAGEEIDCLSSACRVVECRSGTDMPARMRVPNNQLAQT